MVGNGSFGVVYVAQLAESNGGETIAIKKVLQDKRYKNRELQIMRKLDHQVETESALECFSLPLIHMLPPFRMWSNLNTSSS